MSLNVGEECKTVTKVKRYALIKLIYRNVSCVLIYIYVDFIRPVRQVEAYNKYH